MRGTSNIRLIVKTDKDYKSEGETCLVDVSKGLPNVVEQISRQVEAGIIRLCHVVYVDDKSPISTYSAIKDTQFLRDLDVVFAVKQDNAEAGRRVGVAEALVAASGMGATTITPRNGLSKKKKARGQGASKKNSAIAAAAVAPAAPKSPSTPKNGRSTTTSAVASNQSRSPVKPKYALGTKVIKHFPGHGFFDGEITNLDDVNEQYRILYSDGDIETMQYDSPEIDEIVRQSEVTPPTSGLDDEIDELHTAATKTSNQRKRKTPEKKTPKLFRLGTKVKKDFGEYGICDGKIIEVNKKTKQYNVRYDDGDEQKFSFDDPEMPSIIAAAKKSPSKKQKTAAGTPKQGTSGQSSKKSPPTTGSKSSKGKLRKGPLLTAEQRRRLHGHKVDVDHFASFLLEEMGLTQGSVNKILKCIKGLVSGDGVPCKVSALADAAFAISSDSLSITCISRCCCCCLIAKHWAKPFKPDPVEYLSADIYGLFDDAMEHVNIYGDDKTNGWAWKVSSKL